jgi:hypothetical protein
MGLNLGCSWANLIGFSLTRLYSILAEKIIYLNTICMIMGQAMAPNAIFPNQYDFTQTDAQKQRCQGQQEVG